MGADELSTIRRCHRERESAKQLYEEAANDKNRNGVSYR